LIDICCNVSSSTAFNTTTHFIHDPGTDQDARLAKIKPFYQEHLSAYIRRLNMARPRIGIFGALVAVGGLLAWRWAQKHRASQAHLNRDLSRWEDEGGAVVSVAQTAPAAAGPAGAASATGTNGASHPIGLGEAWPFPHS
jgi:hypothetical protein